MSTLHRQAKDTLTAVELDHGDTLLFTLTSGQTVTLQLLSTHAEITRTTLRTLRVEEEAARTDYRFHADLALDGVVHRLEREVSTQQSFYEPWLIGGLRIWLDAVSAIFDFLTEAHGDCAPRKHARLALQQESLRLCPDKLHPWCPLPAGGLKIENCYRGEDCWLGAYNGASAHGGLDLNHPRGTPLWAPLDIHDHFYFNSLKMGQNNNRWRAFHHWENGATWILQAHHMTALTVPEHQPLRRGEQFASGAGVLSGAVDHSHFVFKIQDGGEPILLDPWILFWQMYRDQ
ncbi:MAG: hypothetical protein ABFE08_24415 [Armatimonadia bacterium]